MTITAIKSNVSIFSSNHKSKVLQTYFLSHSSPAKSCTIWSWLGHKYMIFFIKPCPKNLNDHHEDKKEHYV